MVAGRAGERAACRTDTRVGVGGEADFPRGGLVGCPHGAARFEAGVREQIGAAGEAEEGVVNEDRACGERGIVDVEQRGRVHAGVERHLVVNPRRGGGHVFVRHVGIAGRRTDQQTQASAALDPEAGLVARVGGDGNSLAQRGVGRRAAGERDLRRPQAGMRVGRQGRAADLRAVGAFVRAVHGGDDVVVGRVGNHVGVHVADAGGGDRGVRTAASQRAFHFIRRGIVRHRPRKRDRAVVHVGGEHGGGNRGHGRRRLVNAHVVHDHLRVAGCEGAEAAGGDVARPAAGEDLGAQQKVFASLRHGCERRDGIDGGGVVNRVEVAAVDVEFQVVGCPLHAIRVKPAAESGAAQAAGDGLVVGPVAVPVESRRNLVGDVGAGLVHLAVFGDVQFDAVDMRLVGGADRGREHPEGRPVARCVGEADAGLHVAVFRLVFALRVEVVGVVDATVGVGGDREVAVCD